MGIPDDPLCIYLDQNILSRLREGESTKGELLGILRKFEKLNAVFVSSMTHIDECRASINPETFVQVMEELPVYLMELQNAADEQTKLSLGRARELLQETEDAAHLAKSLIEDQLRFMHFASGWLGDIEVEELRCKMASEIEIFWLSMIEEVDLALLGSDVEAQAKAALTAAQEELAAIVENLPFEQARDEWKRGWKELRENLPANLAQLDEIPNEEVVPFILSCLGERGREAVADRYPNGFWSKLERRETGKLAGFAFMLFLCGLVRDRRVKKGDASRRTQHFRGQFRDCAHIENATRCAVFITCDKGAARLASSVYAYAGVETMVIELQLASSTIK